MQLCKLMKVLEASRRFGAKEEKCGLCLGSGILGDRDRDPDGADYDNDGHDVHEGDDDFKMQVKIEDAPCLCSARHRRCLLAEATSVSSEMIMMMLVRMVTTAWGW